MKRIALFLMTNLAVVLVLGIVLSVLQSYLGLSRGSTGGLLLMAFVFGMGGSVISLAMSKWMALRATGAQVIEQPRTPLENWLVDTVQRQARAAGIGLPEVAIYDSPDVNAFATGMNRDKALVAVSTGLLNHMSREEAEAVLGHEVSHVANGDMVTLTLIQGVVNTFVIFLARIVAQFVGDRERGGGLAYIATVFALEMVFGIVASMIVAWFSRQREFRADAGGATLAGREKMIAALERLKHSHESTLDGQLTAFGINGKSSMAALFMSHPPLEKRIEALRNSASF